MNGYKTYAKCEMLDAAPKNNCESKSYVAVKRCRMLRSGVQLYAHDEVPAQLLALLPADKQNKPIFKVYRKPEAIVKHVKDFNYIAFVNTHPNEDVTPENYKNLSIGTVGGDATLVTCDDGNVYVENDIVFTSKEAYKEYEAGKKEVSIGMDCDWRVADTDEYDFEVFDFENVNHLALVDRARAGREAKILDSSAVIDSILGGKHMKKGFLEFFGLKKPVKDSEEKLSDKLFAGVAQIKKEMKDEEVSEVVLSVMDSVTPLNDTEQKKVLTGIIQDALSDPETVLAADDEAKKKLADSVDALYAKCKELDSESAAKIIEDACGSKDAKKPADDADPEDDKGDEGKKDDKGDEGKKDDKGTKDGCGDGKTNDEDAIAKVVEAAVSKALDSAKIDEKVDAAVKKALNLDGAKTPEAKGATTDADINFNAEDCLPNGWGHR